MPNRDKEEIESPYREELEGILAFSTFSEAEETLRKLDILRQKYQLLFDSKGTAHCRHIASLGRKRAELISRNKRVEAQKRKQKQEIANWFRIWLETPALFFDWLELRKNSEEFRALSSIDFHSTCR
jgi:hypothetical protein